ncbi:hypothetical protein TSTA_024750 [Talaromyces stipitatus ATCC 10500]|uniref:Uncharacterized protein n=1 Tax=Talaromyces stipitatus (strain ATCC 10500 / CBS 375.48 / QM 6759 / NRRL 1006) TaxID=441959 RepID=B8M4F8_TALSN|nr:uncharacterized protein TSTA_024750 [Talaromyces stipitatus ATCC 10500]EED19153.1 hypothetical protein TSTA_024750 [Talaromyces stipitatus ATCC 10500]
MDEGDGRDSDDIDEDSTVDDCRGGGLRLRFPSADGEDERGRGERERIRVKILVEVASILSRDRKRLCWGLLDGGEEGSEETLLDGERASGSVAVCASNSIGRVSGISIQQFNRSKADSTWELFQNEQAVIQDEYIVTRKGRGHARIYDYYFRTASAEPRHTEPNTRQQRNVAEQSEQS